MCSHICLHIYTKALTLHTDAYSYKNKNKMESDWGGELMVTSGFHMYVHTYTHASTQAYTHTKDINMFLNM